MLCSLLLLLSGPHRADAAPVHVHVDPRVELLTLVFRLAGSPEFDMESSRSPYAEEIEEWFGPARDHAVIALARDLRAQHGIAFNAVPELAVHLTAPPELRPRLPLDPLPERLDERWKGAPLADFLRELRAFAEETGFEEFFAAHAELYAAAESALAKRIEASGVRAWLDSFFGNPRDTDFQAIPGLLCGGGNYGCSVRLPGGALEICPVLGASSWDAQGRPVYGPDSIPLIAHEFSHAYANPVVDASWKALEPPMRVLFERSRALLERQAYADARSAADETLVRACVLRFVRTRQGEEAAAKAAAGEVERGFTWVPALAERLAEYEAHRERFPTLQDFAPRLVDCLEHEAQSPPAGKR